MSGVVQITAFSKAKLPDSLTLPPTPPPAKEGLGILETSKVYCEYDRH